MGVIVKCLVTILTAALTIQAAVTWEDTFITERQSQASIVNGQFNQPLGSTWKLEIVYPPNGPQIGEPVAFARRTKYQGNYVFKVQPNCHPEYNDGEGNLQLIQLRGSGAIRNAVAGQRYTFGFDFLFSEDDGCKQGCSVVRSPSYYSQELQEGGRFRPPKYSPSRDVKANQWYSFSGQFQVSDDTTLDIVIQKDVCGLYEWNGEYILFDNFRLAKA